MGSHGRDELWTEHSLRGGSALCCFMCEFVKNEQAIKLFKEFSLCEEENMGVNAGGKDGGMSERRSTSVKVMI